ncbi:MAG: N-acyl homoserine lactonase family protein, partial [Bacteroidota bacterium]
MTSSVVNRIAVVLCGYEFIPLSVSYHGAGNRFWHAVPVCTYLLDTDEGYMLIDAGLDEQKLRNETCLNRYFPRPGGHPAPLVTQEHELLPQLAELGVQPNAVTHLILTHLHADHTGNIKRFPSSIVHLQEKEYEASLDLPPSEGYINEEYQGIPLSQMGLYEGDTDLFPGIELIFTPGHTAGHQSILITNKDGRQFIIVGDAVDDRYNL